MKEVKLEHFHMKLDSDNGLMIISVHSLDKDIKMRPLVTMNLEDAVEFTDALNFLLKRK